MRTVGEIISSKDRGETRALSERASVAVVVFDRNVPTRIVSDGGRSIDLQSVEVLGSDSADRTGIIGNTSEDYCRRTAVHSSGSRYEIVSDRCCGRAEICSRPGVIESEIEEGSVSSECLCSGTTLEGDCTRAWRERSAVGPITA